MLFEAKCVKLLRSKVFLLSKVFFEAKCASAFMFFKVRNISILILLTLKNIEYKASIIGILIMLALKNMKYKASIIGILIMLALKNIKYKASIIGILIMLALKNINYKLSSPVHLNLDLGSLSLIQSFLFKI